jgi:hypothetical protein
MTHLLIDTGRASRLAACDEPFANGQGGSEILSEVNCRACLTMFNPRSIR